MSVLAKLVQSTFARATQDAQHSQRVLAAVVAAIEGNPSGLRDVIRDEQTLVADELAQVQAYTVPD